MKFCELSSNADWFLLVPLLIHLLKRMQAKQVMISSLYLLRRKKANLSKD